MSIETMLGDAFSTISAQGSAASATGFGAAAGRDTGAASAAVRAYLARLVTVFDDARAQYGVEATLRLA